MEATATFETTATLRNGMAVTIRDLRPDDRDAIARAASELEAETIYTRLFSYRKITPAAIDRYMRVDPQHEVALVVVTGTSPDQRIIGACRLVDLDPQGGRRRAEVAFTVEEDFQGLGIASRLLQCLIDTARDRGIDQLEADVLASNLSMLRVFERCGLAMRKRREGASMHVTLALGASDGAPP